MVCNCTLAGTKACAECRKRHYGNMDNMEEFFTVPWNMGEFSAVPWNTSWIVDTDIKPFQVAPVKIVQPTIREQISKIITTLSPSEAMHRVTVDALCKLFEDYKGDK